MLTTDCAFLENELPDVIRMFKHRPESVAHTFRFEDGVFCNEFVVDGERFLFRDGRQGQVFDELLFKRYEKRYAKLGLYRVLSEKYGEEMPWGALTGIRPTKVAYMEIEEGRDFHPLFAEMRVSKENTALVERTLKAQEDLYEKKDGNTDLFVSLPFCPTKCAYCSFITAPIERTRAFLPDYLSALEKELKASKNLIGNLRSVYIGGGTPFVLDERELERVLQAVAPLRENGCEYTVEAGRPDVFTEGKLSLLKDYGVTRICINPQTFSDETLKKIGRRHTIADVYRAFEMTKKFDFDVNLDLIAGLADESTETFVNGVYRALETGADNITVHCLSLKAGAKLKEKSDYVENESASEMVMRSRRILTEAGYEPYYMYRQKYQAGNAENVGWTKPKKACIYNIDIMEETADNLAVGSGAVTKKVENARNRIERFGAPKDIPTYLQKIDTLIENKNKFFGKIGVN